MSLLGTQSRPAGRGWIEVRFFGGPADGSRTWFRPGQAGALPTPRMWIRDPAREPGAPVRPEEQLHLYELVLEPNGRYDYRHRGQRRMG